MSDTIHNDTDTDTRTMLWEPLQAVPVAQNSDRPIIVGNHEESPSDDASWTSENSNEWCEGSVGSIISLGDSCYSVTSTFSRENISMTDNVDDNRCIQDLEPVRIGFSESRHISQEQRTDPATIISSACSSTIRSYMEDEEDLDSGIDEIMMYNEQKPPPSDLPRSRLLRPEPFGLLPDELACNVFSFLNVASLSTTRSVSKRFSVLASRDEAGWHSICESIWNRKAQVCWRAIHLKRTSGSMVAYRESCSDGRNRHEITPNELCFDPLTGRGTVWYFRFKESAGSAWTSLDPWYAGLQARKMVFLRDGTVWQLLPASTSSEALGDDEKQYNSSFRLKPAFFDALDARAPARIHHRENAATPSRDGMKWRFILQPMDQPARPRGAFVRLNVGGRDVPTYIVQRSPTKNWGFIMENCWGVFASFPLPLHQSLERPAGDRPARIRLRRTSSGVGRWLNVDGIESDSDEDNFSEGGINEDGDGGEEEDFNTTTDAPLLEDAALPTNNRRQWREALLYNYGAASLPEGESATAEFDRIFQSFRAPRRPLDMHNFLR